jgi:hypothetical protein
MQEKSNNENKQKTVKSKTLARKIAQKELKTR